MATLNSVITGANIHGREEERVGWPCPVDSSSLCVVSVITYD